MRHEFELNNEYDEITQIQVLLTQLPKVKDEKAETCQSLIYTAISVIAHVAAIQNNPVDYVEVEEALHKLRLAVDRAIGADPLLTAIFGQPRPKQKELLAMGLDFET